MDYDELKKVAFSSVKEDDPYKASKQLQIKCWCAVFQDILDHLDEEKLLFFLDVLSDEECWEKTDTLHGIKLNRRIAAKKMVASQNRKGINNPLDDSDRYDIACWCCLEEDIITLFECFKQDHTTESLERFVKRMSGSYYTDAMAEYWSHVVGGYTSGLKLEGQHLYVFGLNRAMSLYRKFVEPVEFFWNKIKSLPENELSTQEKDEILMKAAVCAASNNFSYSDVFEFLFNQMSPDRYPELLKRDLEKNTYYGSLYRMLDVRNFNQFQRLFDCLKPSDVPKGEYGTWLRCIRIENCSGQYTDAGVKLLMHMLMKEGFDDYRTSALNGEMVSNSVFQGRLLVPLVEKGCMEAVWAVLDRANPKQIKEFMNSKKASDIRSVLEQRNDNSLNKFLSYSKYVADDFNQKSKPGPSGDLAGVEVKKAHKKSHIGLNK